MAAQKAPPTTVKSRNRPQEPCRSCRRRASAPRHLGVRSVQIPGWVGGASTSVPEHGVELGRAGATRQLEEEILQAHPGRLGLLPKIVHGAAGGDPTLVDDRDP